MGGARRSPSVLVVRPHRLDHAGILLDVARVVLMGYASLHPSYEADVFVLGYGYGNFQVSCLLTRQIQSKKKAAKAAS